MAFVITSLFFLQTSCMLSPIENPVSYDYFNDKIVMDIMGNESRKIEIGMDPLGNIARINNAIEGMTKRFEDMQTLLDNTKRQLENARIETAV